MRPCEVASSRPMAKGRRVKNMRNFMVLAVGFLALAACAAPTQKPAPKIAPAPVEEEARLYPQLPPPEEDRILIALLAPRSGQHARLGEALMNAAELALFDARDPRLELRAYDTEALSGKAAGAAYQATEDGARIILGPLFSASVQAVGPIAREAGIPVIAFSNDPAAAAPGVYLMGLQPAQEVERVVRFAAQERDLRRLAALVPVGPYGETVLHAFGEAAIEGQAEVRAIELYERSVDEMTEPVKEIADYDRRARWLREEREFLNTVNDDLANEFLQRLANQDTLTQPDFDAILIAEGGQLLRTMAPLLAIYEVDPDKIRFLGTGLWNDPGLTREPPLHGAWFAAPPEDGFRAFSERYSQAFGRAPARISALAYDAMAMSALLSREPIIEQRFSTQAIIDPNGFMGVMGLFRFTKDGIAERGLAVMEIQPEGFKMLSQAPKSFEPAFTN